MIALFVFGWAFIGFLVAVGCLECGMNSRVAIGYGVLWPLALAFFLIVAACEAVVDAYERATR